MPALKAQLPCISNICIYLYVSDQSVLIGPEICPRPGLEVINLLSCSTQLSTKFILLMNVKMPTIIIVGIFTFISMINTTSERLKERNFFICRYFSFYEQLKFCAQVS